MIGVGEAAARLGVATHVLRHWEDMGVLDPARTPAGHRRYTDAEVDRGRLILRCQRAGLSLAEIRALVGGGQAVGDEMLGRRVHELRQSLADGAAILAWLEHTQSCTARSAGGCDVCAELARDACPRGDARCGDALGGAEHPHPL